MYRDIISTAELVPHLNAPNWIVIDCRFELSRPAWGEEEFAKAHIPGAMYAHLDRDLSGPVTPQTGRHPLPDPQTFVERLSSWGIDEQKQVVVYDHVSGSMAARLWWMLKYYGHDAVAVLDGGYTRWLAENRPVDATVKKVAPATFTPHIRQQMLVSAGDVLESLNEPSVKLIDARAPARYNGETEPIDAFAGHIPSALNRFHGENLSSDGVLLSPGQLKAQFSALLDGAAAADAIVYCGSGVTSCHHILAMSVAGIPLPRLYAGSWSEWIRDPQRPTSPAR